MEHRVWKDIWTTKTHSGSILSQASDLFWVFFHYNDPSMSATTTFTLMILVEIDRKQRSRWSETRLLVPRTVFHVVAVHPNPTVLCQTKVDLRSERFPLSTVSVSPSQRLTQGSVDLFSTLSPVLPYLILFRSLPTYKLYPRTGTEVLAVLKRLESTVHPNLVYSKLGTASSSLSLFLNLPLSFDFLFLFFISHSLLSYKLPLEYVPQFCP